MSRRLLPFFFLISVSASWAQTTQLASVKEDQVIVLGEVPTAEQEASQQTLYTELKAHSEELVGVIDSLRTRIGELESLETQSDPHDLQQQIQTCKEIIANCQQMLRTNERILKGYASIAFVEKE